MKKSILIETQAEKDKKEFEEKTDYYTGIIEKMVNVFREEDLSLDETLLVLEALTTSITELKFRSYENIVEVLNSN